MNNTKINIPMLCVTDPQRALSASLVARNLKHFQFALEYGANPNVRDKPTGFSVFEHACQTPGSAQFILECLHHEAEVQLQNANGKYPIHFVASSADPGNVRVLLENAKPSLDISYQDQTALHMLLEHINEDNWKDAFSCVKQLLTNGADPNIPNDDNRTAIGVFVKNSKNWQKNAQDWRKEVLVYCLKNTHVDVDTFRKGELRKKIVEYFPDVSIPSFTMETNLGVVISLIKSQSEGKFERQFKQYRNNVKDEVAWKSDLKELLKAAVQTGKISFVKTLLKDDNYLFDASSDLPTLLSICCNYGYHEILAFILSKTGVSKADIQLINMEPLLSLVIKEINITKDRNKCPFFKCLELLLGDNRIEVDKVDEKGFSALHYAVKYKVDSAVDLLLKRGSAYIGTMNMFKELPICEIDADVLEEYLDYCLTTNEKRPGDDEYEINIDFSCLVPPVYKRNYSGNKNGANTRTMTDEMLPIVYMANSNDLKHLLKHPVISSYVLIKWLRLSIYFYINLVICTLFFLSFTWYVVGCYGQDNVNQGLKTSLRIISLVGATYMAVREIGQMLLHAKAYFCSLENWMELTLIMASFTVLMKEYQDEMRQIISAVVILLSAVEFTLLVGTLPVLSISTHMVMLKTVSKNFLKSLILYSIILISFAFCFYTLFNIRPDVSPRLNENGEPEEDTFNKFADIKTALLKTFVMLTGEFEAAAIKFDSNGLSYFIFLLFLFFVAMVIFNLMNGLAVSDTAVIKAEAELIGLCQKVNVISKYENGLKTSKTKGIFQRIIFSVFPTTFLHFFPDFLPYHRVIVAPNQSNTILIPRPQKNPDAESVIEVESLAMVELIPESSCFNERIKLTIGCCVLPSFSRMDNKIMKYAKKILHTRNKRSNLTNRMLPLEERISRIERNIELILHNFVAADVK